MSFRVAIIGAGRIGAVLDEPGSPHVLTHAHGYRRCNSFEIAGFVDADLDKARAASRRWGGDAFESIQELFAAYQIDGVSICLPDEMHYSALRDLSAQRLKFIFLEKPPVSTETEADEIGKLYRGAAIRIQVNYTRRFVPEIRAIRESIRSGVFGNFITGTGYYGKGLCHNGSHLLDLLQFLLGGVDRVTRTATEQDFYEHDPSVSALLTLNCGGTFHLRHIDCRNFHIFELDLTFDRKRIRIYDLGRMIEEYSAGESGLIEGLQVLNKESEYRTQYSTAMACAIENIRGNLERDEPMVCSLEESLETVRTCARIMRSNPE